MHWIGRDVFAAGKPDKPLDFSKDGGLSDYGTFEREEAWSNCSYFYLDKPENELPAILY